MRLLLDSHTLIWAVDEPTKLGATAAATLQDPGNDLIVSAGSVWEIAIKVGLKKLTLSRPFRPWIEKAIADLGASLLPITIEHADALVGLPMHHRDPFDRLLVAQSMVEKLLMVSADAQLDAYGITRHW
jgi:PIN domain nuclease of toxin-antitoxin system